MALENSHSESASSTKAIIELERKKERKRRVDLYSAFLQSPLQPACRRIYYPGCGEDDAATEAFADREIFLVDTDPTRVETLRSKNFPSSVHVEQASAEVFDPGVVDTLLLHGCDRAMQVDFAIKTLIEGGFLLSGDDAAMKLRAEFLQRDDLEFVGILRPTEDVTQESLMQIQDSTRMHLRGVSIEYCFEKAREEHVIPVETDEEFRRAAPETFAIVEKQLNAIREWRPNQNWPTSVLAYAKEFPQVSIPPKNPVAVLWIFRKRKEECQKQ